MTLLQEIKAKCSPELIASRSHGLIAEQVSVGRTRIVPRVCGIGTVIETLGAESGASVLDTLIELRASNPVIRWGWLLLEKGELDFGSPVTRQMIDDLASSGVVTSAQANKLKDLAVVSAPVSVQEVVSAMEGL